jgi:hypothetical protein
MKRGVNEQLYDIIYREKEVDESGEISVDTTIFIKFKIKGYID